MLSPPCPSPALPSCCQPGDRGAAQPGGPATAVPGQPGGGGRACAGVPGPHTHPLWAKQHDSGTPVASPRDHQVRTRQTVRWTGGRMLAGAWSLSWDCMCTSVRACVCACICVRVLVYVHVVVCLPCVCPHLAGRRAWAHIAGRRISVHACMGMCRKKRVGGRSGHGHGALRGGHDPYPTPLNS